MFGEEISESPRQPSPWEELYPSTLENGTIVTPKLHVKHPFPRTGLPKDNLLEQDGLYGSDFLDSNKASWESLAPEVDEIGHIEYKLKLVANTPERFQKLVTQLKWRLAEGGGIALYEIGLLDSGSIVGLSRGEMDSSLNVLTSMAQHLGAKVNIVREIEVTGSERGLRELKKIEDDKRTKKKKLPSFKPPASSKVQGLLIKGMKPNTTDLSHSPHNDNLDHSYSSSSPSSLEDETFHVISEDVEVPFFDLTLDDETFDSNSSLSRRYSDSSKVVFVSGEPEFVINGVNPDSLSSSYTVEGGRRKGKSRSKGRSARKRASKGSNNSSGVIFEGSTFEGSTSVPDRLSLKDLSSIDSDVPSSTPTDGQVEEIKYVVEVLVKLEESERFLDIEGFTPDT